MRYYSPAKVVEMMRHLRENYGVRHIMFVRLMKFAFDYLLCRVRRHAPEPLGSQKQRDSEL
ncbi:MAG: hypothetical protein KZQ99_11555 [Candidatus Thiodiazotropha sp. (ex Dulcina madagascariensis)]|nr:hypothetical protein [Candidatus Thiodiazotropha sp. (ex Dulcina madagascariensis)]